MLLIDAFLFMPEHKGESTNEVIPTLGTYRIN